MSADFIRPIPAIPVDTEVLFDADLVDEVLPELFAEHDVLNSQVRLPLNEGIQDFGYWLGAPRDAYCLRTHLRAQYFDVSGMAEVIPTIGPSQFSQLTRDEAVIDPIIHLPQQAETLALIADNVKKTGLVIAGLITLRTDESLYQSHAVLPAQTGE